MRKLLLILSIGFSIAIKAQVTYVGTSTKIGLMDKNENPVWQSEEKLSDFTIYVDEKAKTIKIKEGTNVKDWMTITIDKKKTDANGDLIYTGCLNSDGEIEKDYNRATCFCELFVLKDVILLQSNGGGTRMLFWYYRGTSLKWGRYS